MKPKIKLLLPLLLAAVLISSYLLFSKSKSPTPEQLPVEEIGDYNSKLLSTGNPDELVKIAKQRKSYLLDLIKEDPDQAYSLFLTADQINAMPAQVREYLEKDVEISGTLQITHSDDFQNAKSSDYYSIYVKETKTTYYLSVKKNESKPFEPYGKLTSIPSSANVTLTAKSLGTSIPMESGFTQTTVQLNSPAINNKPDITSQTTVKYLLLLANNNDYPNERPIADSQPFQHAFNKSDGIKAYINEASYGTESLDVTFDDTWYDGGINKPLHYDLTP